ncbi:MAG: copper resistance protein CopC, partial [Actinomycetota bacterium]
MRATVVGACAGLCFLFMAGAAQAHAFLLRATPSPGGQVPTAPASVDLYFTEGVRPVDSGIVVVRAGGHSVMAGKPYVPQSNPREIIIPLRCGLGEGPYAVRWSEVDVDDGHVISGAFIFSVGGGLPPTASTASATVTGGSPPASALISRWLELAGLLVAAGVAAFAVLVRGAAERVRAAVVVGASLAVATLGAVLWVVLQSGESGTRSGHWTIVGACIAGVASAAAFASLRMPGLWLPAAVASVVLLGLPTATGHASASGRSHWLSIPADVLHLAAAAVWIGGIVALLLVVPPASRVSAARRFTPEVVLAVGVLGATGVLRAYGELDSVHQVWTTGYGQALLVKTGVLGAVLVLGWLNRGRFGRLGLAGELALLAVVIGAVAVLTNVRPGVDQGAAAPVAATDTVVYAGEAGPLAVGLAATPAGKQIVLKATVLGQNGPKAGLDVGLSLDGRDAAGEPCGAGCYTATFPAAGAPKTL